MRIGVTLEDSTGLEGNISLHFGQCSHFLIVDIEDNQIKSSKVVPNEAMHGGGNCAAVDVLAKYEITHVIAGGMGAGAQQKFQMVGIQVFGSSGSVKEALNSLLSNLLTDLDSCKDGHSH